MKFSKFEYKIQELNGNRPVQLFQNIVIQYENLKFRFLFWEEKEDLIYFDLDGCLESSTFSNEEDVKFVLLIRSRRETA